MRNPAFFLVLFILQTMLNSSLLPKVLIWSDMKSANVQKKKRAAAGAAAAVTFGDNNRVHARMAENAWNYLAALHEHTNHNPDGSLPVHTRARQLQSYVPTWCVKFGKFNVEQEHSAAGCQLQSFKSDGRGHGPGSEMQKGEGKHQPNDIGRRSRKVAIASSTGVAETHNRLCVRLVCCILSTHRPKWNARQTPDASRCGACSKT